MSSILAGLRTRSVCRDSADRFFPVKGSIAGFPLDDYRDTTTREDECFVRNRAHLLLLLSFDWFGQQVAQTI